MPVFGGIKKNNNVCLHRALTGEQGCVDANDIGQLQGEGVLGHNKPKLIRPT